MKRDPRPTVHRSSSLLSHKRTGAGLPTLISVIHTALAGVVVFVVLINPLAQSNVGGARRRKKVVYLVFTDLGHYKQGRIFRGNQC